MKSLDHLLLDSWHAVSAELKDKPWKLGRRMERVARKELRRPVRAWSLGLRASARRIGAHELRGEMDQRCCDKGYPHGVTLTGERVRALCKPVRIDWPGVPVVEAAALLGRDPRTVWSWVKQGILHVERGAALGRRGKPKHLVRTTTAIDPQADGGRGPWTVWGSLWQGLYERVPEDFEQRVQRVARVRRLASDHEQHPGHYRGWDWVCPGRSICNGTATEQHVACGRVCKKLWLPLPAWTIGDALGERAGEAWGRMPRFEVGRASFACARCWGLRFDCDRSEPEEAWNRFVSVISGGLLYGREVDRGLLSQGAVMA